MRGVKADLDYEDIRVARRIRIGNKMYRASAGSLSEAQAVQDVKYFESQGYKDVKLVECKAFFVCIPEDESSALDTVLAGAHNLSKDARKKVKKAGKVVHEVTGDILNRNSQGEAAVKKLLGWNGKTPKRW